MLEHCSLTEYRRVSLRVQWTDGRTDAQLRSDGRDRRIKPADRRTNRPRSVSVWNTWHTGIFILFHMDIFWQDIFKYFN